MPASGGLRVVQFIRLGGRVLRLVSPVLGLVGSILRLVAGFRCLVAEPRPAKPAR
jgi:hypothetical protein